MLLLRNRNSGCVICTLTCMLLLISCEENQSSEDTVNRLQQEVAADPEQGESSNSDRVIEVPYDKENAIDSTVLEGGLILYYIEKGSGPTPSVERNILVNYHGMLEDGTVFDSSFEKGQPMDSPLSRLVRGWQIALSEVPVGSKVKLVIPPELGYGQRGQGNIPPQATLIFDIELISMY